jgi:hypothetical protein
VDQEQQNRQQQQSNGPPTRTRKQGLLWTGGILVALAFLMIVICGYLFGLKWTGLPKRTLWDWMELLIIPAVLAGGGLWFSRQQREQEMQIAAQQRVQELEAADGRAQDEALQAYLDQMSDMLIPNKDQPSLYKARPGDSLSSVARARTLTVLPRLDSVRKARVLQFLHESGLIERRNRVVDLRQADFSGANLQAANLEAANLSQADLSRVDLTGAYMPGADLSWTNLRGADLTSAHLFEANLHAANLSEAHLTWSTLSEADLRWVNLREAKGLANERLANETLEAMATKSLKGATMPDGLRYEDWLKSEDREQERENSDPL